MNHVMSGGVSLPNVGPPRATNLLVLPGALRTSTARAIDVLALHAALPRRGVLRGRTTLTRRRRRGV